MLRRGYSPAQKTYDDIFSVSKLNDFEPVSMDDLFRNWHDQKYLDICLRNLEEKAMGGGIDCVEWSLICEKYGKQTDLWNQT